MRLILGPFVGEFGWELCYWQAHGRWLKDMVPDIEIYAVTFPGRQVLYRDFADRIVFHSEETMSRFGRLDSYNSQGFDRKEYFVYVGRMIERFHAYGAVTTPNHNGRFYIDPDKMVFRRFQSLKSLGDCLELEEVEGKRYVMLFPRQRGDGRDWPEKNWSRLLDLLLKGGYGVVIGGVQGFSSLVKGKGKGIVNLVARDEFHALDLVVHYLNKVGMALGSQSALPILSLHQGVPTLMWGHEQERHERELNWFDTPCRFVLDERYDMSAERIFEEFKEFEKEVK